MFDGTLAQVFHPAMFASSFTAISAYHLIIVVEVVTIVSLSLLLITRLFSLGSKSPPGLRVLPGPKGMSTIA
jgi:hypothetical protein